MTYEQSTDYLLSLLGARGQRYGLERITRLVELLGRPDRALRIIHVAGTNGKGSVCAMIDAGLRAAGKQVGFHSSPHLTEFTERYKINGQLIENQKFADIVAHVKQGVEAMAAESNDQLLATLFEAATAIAFCAFQDAGVEWAVIETGLGGRLDATNVVEPELAVITPISFDHQDKLGHDLASIAGEKAGILKTGSRAVFSRQEPEAAQVLAERGKVCESVVWAGQAWRVRESSPDPRGRYRILVDGPDGKRVSALIALPGEHQVENAVTALAALDAVGVPLEAIECGLESVDWPARLEWLGTAPEVLLDSAHNPAGAASLARYLRDFCADRRITLVFGASKDKAYGEVARILFPLAERVILTQAAVSRAATAAELRDAIGSYEGVVESAPTVAEAWGLASRDCSPNGLVVISGSIFLAGEARELLRAQRVSHA
jgi:dihydrofolate synthase/folylpolyglutamate synthase